MGQHVGSNLAASGKDGTLVPEQHFQPRCAPQARNRGREALCCTVKTGSVPQTGVDETRCSVSQWNATQRPTGGQGSMCWHQQISNM